MRIVQLIDSLDTGGAERMAVNFANALSEKIEFSGLVATRAEGNLLMQVSPKVEYLFLRRRTTFDVAAAIRLKKFCRTNNVGYIHAHSSSYFMAMLVKILMPRLKVLWHDHNGMSEFLNSRESYALKLASLYFTGIIVVNHQLKKWAIRVLKCKNVVYLANFTQKTDIGKLQTVLHGEPRKKILCLANLREQKNHLMLIEVAKIIEQAHPEWTFHLVGKDFNDAYSAQVRNAISDNGLEDRVFIYGSCNDTEWIIRQSDIAILTSRSEGLPVALLEFGMQRKPVVVTGVGEIPEIIKNGINGFIVEPNQPEAFAVALSELILSKELRTRFGDALFETIKTNHSSDAVIAKYKNWIESIDHV